MINAIWFAMVALGILGFAAKGDVDLVTTHIVNESGRAVQFALGLVGLISFWTGLMRVAEEAGLTRLLARGLRPIAKRLFPSIPADGPAMGAILMAMSANILGLGNAATPLGLKAMSELQKLNRNKPEATAAMCTLLAISTSSITLIPATVIAIRAQTGSSDPAGIVGTTLLATVVSTSVALVADALFRRAQSRSRSGGGPKAR